MLHRDPRLPPHWSAFEVRVQFHGHPVRCRKERGRAVVWSDGQVPLRIGGLDLRADVGGIELRRSEQGWELE